MKRLAIILFLGVMASVVAAQDTTIVLDKQEFSELKKEYCKRSYTIPVKSGVFVRKGDLSYYLLRDKKGRNRALFNERKSLLLKRDQGAGFRLNNIERIEDGDSVFYFLKADNCVIAIYYRNSERLLPISSDVVYMPKREKGYVWYNSGNNKQLWPVQERDAILYVKGDSDLGNAGYYTIDGRVIIELRSDDYYLQIEPSDTLMLYFKKNFWDKATYESDSIGVYTFDGKVIVPPDKYDFISTIAETVEDGGERYYSVRFFEVVQNRNGVTYIGAYPINEEDKKRYGVVPAEYYNLAYRDGKLLVNKSSVSDEEEYSREENYQSKDRDLGEHYFRAREYDKAIMFYSQNREVKPWGIYYSAISFYEKAEKIEDGITNLYNTIHSEESEYRTYWLNRYLKEKSLDIKLMRHFYHQAYLLFELYDDTKDEEFKDTYRHYFSGYFERDDNERCQKIAQMHKEDMDWLAAQIAGDHPEYAEYRAIYERTHAEEMRREQNGATFWDAAIGNIAEGISRNFSAAQPSDTVAVSTVNADELAEAFYGEGVDYFNAGDMDKSLEAFRKCDSLRTKAADFVGITTNTKQWIAHILLKKGRSQEAYETDCFYYRLQPVDYRMVPEQLKEESRMMEKMYKGDFEAAYNIASAAMRRDVEMLGERHYIVGNSYLLLGDLSYNIASRQSSAINMYRKAFDIFNGYDGAAENICQLLRIKMAGAYLVVNQPQKAEEIIPDYDSVISELRCTWFDVEIGIAIQKSDIEAVVRTGRAYMASTESRKDYGNFTNMANVLINVLIAKGDVTGALDVSDTTCQVMKEGFGESSLEYLQAVVLKATLLDNIGRWREAQMLYITSVKNFDFVGSGQNIIDNIIECRIDEVSKYMAFAMFEDKLLTMSSNVADKGTIFSFCEKLVKDLKQKEWWKYEGRPGYAVLMKLYFSSQLFMGMQLYLDGKGAQAVDIFEDILIAKKENKDLEYYTVKTFCGLYYYYTENYAKALTYLEDCVKKTEDPLGQIELMAAMYYVMQKGVSHKTIELCKSSFDKLKKNFVSLAVKVSQSNKLYLWNQYKISFGMLVTIANNIAERKGEMNNIAYNSILMGKSFLLSSQTDVQRAVYNSGNAEIIRQYENIQRMYAQNIDATIDPESYAALLDAESKLMMELADQNDFMSKYEITTDDVKRYLAGRSVAVEFVYARQKIELNDSAYYAFVLRDGWEYPKQIALDISGDFFKRDDLYTDPRLTERIWGEIVRKAGVRPGDTIYFAADQNLHTISVENMAWGENGEPMSTVFNMCRVTSTRDVALAKEESGPGTAEVYGGVNYTMKRGEMEAQSKRYAGTRMVARRMQGETVRREMVNYLPGTRRESEEISRLLKANGVEVRLHSGMRANEESFKALSGKGRSIIHVATHGFAWSDSVARQQRNYDMMNQGQNTNMVNPLSRCGLLMAGANMALSGRSDELPEGVQDGILTAEEISEMDLSGCDLVVLSACETAQGDVTPDGVFGVQRAFKMAGVRSIIMSLWKVDDNATQMLMTEFYRNWIERGQPKREAFRNAQNAVRSAVDGKGRRMYESPEFWAGFVMLD